MRKKYAPVQISNPTTENHLVRLCPNQSFQIRLDGWFEAVDVDYTSRLFSLRDETHDAATGTRTLFFEQNLDLTLWSKVSNVFLGEIVVLGRTTTCSVCVVLDSTNPCKDFITTAVNPLGAELKIEPHQVLEVVLYDSYLGPNDSWDVDILPGDDNLQYELLGHEVLRPHQLRMTSWAMRSADEVYFTGPRQVEAVRCSQHHFWFRCDAPTISLLATLPSGVASGGNLVFSGESQNGDQTNVSYNLNIRLNLKRRDKLYQGLLLPRREGSPHFTVMGPHLPMKQCLLDHYRSKKYRNWNNLHKKNFVRPVILKKKKVALDTGF